MSPDKEKAYVLWSAQPHEHAAVKDFLSDNKGKLRSLIAQMLVRPTTSNSTFITRALAMQRNLSLQTSNQTTQITIGLMACGPEKLIDPQAWSPCDHLTVILVAVIVVVALQKIRRVPSLHFRLDQSEQLQREVDAEIQRFEQLQAEQRQRQQQLLQRQLQDRQQQQQHHHNQHQQHQRQRSSEESLVHSHENSTSSELRSHHVLHSMEGALGHATNVRREATRGVEDNDHVYEDDDDYEDDGEDEEEVDAYDAERRRKPRH